MGRAYALYTTISQEWVRQFVLKVLLKAGLWWTGDIHAWSLCHSIGSIQLYVSLTVVTRSNNTLQASEMCRFYRCQVAAVLDPPKKKPNRPQQNNNTTTATTRCRSSEKRGRGRTITAGHQNTDSGIYSDRAVRSHPSIYDVCSRLPRHSERTLPATSHVTWLTHTSPLLRSTRTIAKLNPGTQRP